MSNMNEIGPGIAAALSGSVVSGWKYEAFGDDVNCGWRGLLVCCTGFKLFIHAEVEGKLSVHVMSPDGCRSVRVPFPKPINVSISRGPAVIAREIINRFLPVARSWWLNEKQLAADASEAFDKRKAAAQAFAKSAGTDARESSGEFTIYLDGAQFVFTGESVKVERLYVSPAIALKLLEVLKKVELCECCGVPVENCSCLGPARVPEVDSSAESCKATVAKFDHFPEVPFDESECGGAFDGSRVISDADSDL